MWLAERQIRVVAADGTAALAELRIGLPQAGEDDWSCAVELGGLSRFSGTRRIYGVDAWQATLLAFRFVNRALHAQIDRGARLCWPDSEDPYDIDDILPLNKTSD